jgi:flagellin
MGKLIINHNISALNTYRQLSSNNVLQNKSLEKLSSGFRINRAGDDAAGLAISEKMRGQIRGLNQASRNAQDGISLIQTAEGALNETHAILQRMRELAVQASTDTNTNEDRAEIQKEIDQLATEITRIADTTQFNTMNLLNGDFKGKVFHIGANAQQNASIEIAGMRAYELGVGTEGSDGSGAAASGTIQEITITANSVGSQYNKTIKIEQGTGNNAETAITETDDEIIITLGTDSEGAPLTVTQDEIVNLINGLGTYTATTTNPTGSITTGEAQISGGIDAGEPVPAKGIDVSTQAAADAAISIIDTAISTVSSERAKLGAMQNRLEHTIANLTTAAENLQASESRIRDVDMAKEMMEFTKMNILSQAATAMLAQANQQPQMVLQLLR